MKSISGPAVFVFLSCLLSMSKVVLSVAENPQKTWRSVINCWTERALFIYTLKDYCYVMKGFDILMFP